MLINHIDQEFPLYLIASAIVLADMRKHNIQITAG
ncbi:uncharacterized protein METZ01_LOCUS432850, partial [marine metagenome]